MSARELLEAEMRVGLFAMAVLSLALGACSTYSGYAHSNAGHAYILEGKSGLFSNDQNVWNCDATGGSPQCWRVLEK
jgi:hypothetical protein